MISFDVSKSAAALLSCLSVVCSAFVAPAVVIATALADAFGTDINGLPLSLIISWYEQKAVAVLLALLSLGIRNIYLGPVLPAFISPNVLQYLTDTFGLRQISNPEDGIKTCLKQNIR